MPVPSDQVAALRSYLAGDFSDCGKARHAHSITSCAGALFWLANSHSL